MGPAGVRELPRRAARHRHLPPGQPGISRPDRVDQGSRRRNRRLSGHLRRHRFAHHHGQRPRRSRLGRRRHRGGSRHARPADLHAAAGSHRLQADRQDEGRRHRDRPRADRRADAAPEGRGRQVRRVLRRRPRSPDAGRRATIGNMGPEYGATCGFFPIDRNAELSQHDRPRRRPHRAGRGLCQGRACSARPASPTRSSPTRWNSTSATSCRRWPARSVRKAARRWKPSAEVREAFVSEYKKNPAELDKRYAVEGEDYDLGHGDVAIAAITSCTNTSNPSVLIGAGSRRPQGGRRA
jgi:hypothetical protein